MGTNCEPKRYHNPLILDAINVTVLHKYNSGVIVFYKKSEVTKAEGKL